MRLQEWQCLPDYNERMETGQYLYKLCFCLELFSDAAELSSGEQIKGHGVHRKRCHVWTAKDRDHAKNFHKILRSMDYTLKKYLFLQNPFGEQLIETSGQRFDHSPVFIKSSYLFDEIGSVIPMLPYRNKFRVIYPSDLPNWGINMPSRYSVNTRMLCKVIITQLLQLKFSPFQMKCALEFKKCAVRYLYNYHTFNS